MPASFRILKNHGMVFVTYHGHANLEDTLAVFTGYLQHPDCQPGQKHLVDFSRVTGWDADYVELMGVQAKKAGAFLGHASQTLIVYYATTELGRTIAQLAVNSWEPFPAVVPILQDSQEKALAILGLEHTSFSQLLDEPAQ